MCAESCVRQHVIGPSTAYCGVGCPTQSSLKCHRPGRAAHRLRIVWLGYRQQLLPGHHFVHLGEEQFPLRTPLSRFVGEQGKNDSLHPGVLRSRLAKLWDRSTLLYREPVDQTLVSTVDCTPSSLSLSTNTIAISIASIRSPLSCISTAPFLS